MTKTKDPWQEIDPPSISTQYNGTRVDASLKWDFFWARGADGKCALILKHSEESRAGINPPKLRGIEVSFVADDQGGQSTLVFKLHESEHRDIFHQLCSDIVESAAGANKEKEAVAVTVARAWRWHYLLRAGQDGRLSIEEQKGLIGELFILKRILLPNLSALDSVNCWTGPLDAPKDFEVGDVCIESKARRGASTPFVTINSEFQLDETSVEALYLHVTELNRTPPDTSDVFSLTDVARKVGDRLAHQDPAAIVVYENLLASSGFDWNDDYSDCVFLEGTHMAYLVQDDFPRITPSHFGPGLSRVRYSLSLTDCDPYLQSYKDLLAKIGSVSNGK